MKQIIILLVLTSSLLSANFSAHYDVDVSLFGKVGYININLDEKNENYTMELVAKTSGAAAALTQNRTETYISKGKIINNNYVPDSFVKIKKTNHKTRIQTYHFEHDKKKISFIEEKEKLVTSSGFDPISFKITESQEIKTSKNESILDRYHTDDVLSSYLNTKNSFDRKKEYVLEAIGAHNDEKDVSLHLLDDKQKASIISHFSNDIVRVCNLHVKPVDKNEKVVDVLMAFGDDGHLKEAYLGDIFWIGQVTAKRTDHKSTCE